jgi:hypothetical protein
MQLDLQRLILNPFRASPILPKPTSDDTICICENAHALLLPTRPHTFNLRAVGPEEGAWALFLVVSVGADEFSAVCPSEDTMAVHFVVVPLACVLALVFPVVGAVAADVVSLESAFIPASVSPGEVSLSLLPSISVLTLIGRAIWPGFNTIPFLLV